MILLHIIANNSCHTGLFFSFADIIVFVIVFEGEVLFRINFHTYGHKNCSGRFIFPSLGRKISNLSTKKQKSA